MPDIPPTSLGQHDSIALGPTAAAELFSLDRLDDDRFRHVGKPVDPRFTGLFGGVPLALALRAAGLTVAADRHPHSLHAYFLRPGSSVDPMDLQVERDTDGRSFSARRVVVTQQGRTVFTMSASFHVREEGPELAVAAFPVDVPDPDSLPAGDLLPFRPSSAVEVRNVGTGFGSAVPNQAWGRAVEPVGDDPLLHACVLVHFSDLYTGLPARPGTGDAGGPSLDHGFWFHRPPDLDDWVLMDLRPIAAAGGRGLYGGSFFDRRGRLLASLTQEVLYSSSRPPRQLPAWLEAEKQPPPHGG
ncbi:MAG TPA: acyl-CoA thioesterase domain-containing protein [Acidimicrobiales bacterium]|jgi:acyl-CoA thioesterase-2